jgi:hypothetical protein
VKIKDLLAVWLRDNAADRATRARQAEGAYPEHTVLGVAALRLARVHRQAASLYVAELQKLEAEPSQSGDQIAPDTAEPAEKQPDSR